jgi:hypothetical protein
MTKKANNDHINHNTSQREKVGLMIGHACDGWWWLVMRCEWWGKVVVAVAVVVNMVGKKSNLSSVSPQTQRSRKKQPRGNMLRGRWCVRYTSSLYILFAIHPFYMIRFLSAQNCTICADGSETVPLPNQDLTNVMETLGYTALLASVGITTVSCGMASMLLPLLPDGLTLEQCATLHQTAGPICGCTSDYHHVTTVAPTITISDTPTSSPQMTSVSPANGCYVCLDGMDLQFANRTVDKILLEYSVLRNDTPLTATALHCNQIAGNSFPVVENQCSEFQSRVSEHCRCSSSSHHADTFSPVMAPTQTATLSPSSMETSGQNNVSATTTASIQQNSCPLCWDASIPSNRDKDITQILLENVSSRQILKSLGLKQVNCFQVYSIVQFLPADSISSSDCNSLQTGIGGICGCTPRPSSCQFCPKEEIPFPDAPYYYSRYAFNSSISCAETRDGLTQVSADTPLCFLSHLTNFVCGCNDGKRAYFGTTADGQRAALVWVPRVTGGLSLFGSMFVVYDILRKQRSNHQQQPSVTGSSALVKSQQVFHTLVLAMASFDIINSICWMLSTAPTPKTDHYGSPRGVYGAIGTDETCAAQAFFFSVVRHCFYDVQCELSNLLLACDCVWDA